jgi:uncharacterized membrane protein YeaQ/YmgE (transglycosylase-associated protein family)
MTLENIILSVLAGFFMGWLSNRVTKSRYSFPNNAFVCISGALLLNFFLRSTGLIADSFMAIFTASSLGAAVLATLFHLVRSLERRQ